MLPKKRIHFFQKLVLEAMESAVRSAIGCMRINYTTISIQKIALTSNRPFNWTQGIFNRPEEPMTERCSVCARPFAPQFAYQLAVMEGTRRYFCSLDCRKG